MSGSVGGSIPCKKTSLASRRRYRASNFTDVIVNTMSNTSGMQKSAANKLPHKRERERGGERMSCLSLAPHRLHS